ncbi:hypothetical protein [Microscilla marina]|uniref:Uncharacterized protein n=1 Tax=Microscilla marina ATCC 23134 TaxID=313606 RepID=A1ZK19_MICM2|nr:hypothetical protein [Microscilla marina]EAY29472.1 hypothetical protein M23134_01532 [Microscilla marina ATCC 23134]
MDFPNNHLQEKLKQIQSHQTGDHTSVGYTEHQSLNDFREIYSNASSRLQDRPYALQKRVIYKVATVWNIMYHPFSFLLGVGSVLLFATTFSGQRSLGDVWSATTTTLVNIALVALGLLLLLISIEVIKASQANTVFRARAKKQHVSIANKAVLGVVMMSSILISGIGGMYVSYELGDKSRDVETSLQRAQDSIRLVYAQKIKQNDQVIQGLQRLQINPELRRWGLTKQESAQLRLAQAEKKRLALAQEKSLANIRNKYGQIIKQNVSYTSATMFVVMIIVTLMELLNVWSYYFVWVYRKRVQDEGVQFGILPVVEEEKTPPVIVKDSTTTSSTPVVYDKKRSYDFATDALPVGDEIECNNETCKKRFRKRSYNHRFCSDQCRLDFHGFDVRRHRRRR